MSLCFRHGKWLLLGIVVFNVLRLVFLESKNLFLYFPIISYLDLFFGAHSLYNTTLKLLFLGSSYAIVYFMTYVYPLYDV